MGTNHHDEPKFKFMFATGIENSYPTIKDRDGKKFRVDELEKCDHYRRWREDFQLVKELGISHLRYGPPYYRTHLGPGRYDWSWCDEPMQVLREMGINPIIDLCHFGVPDWLENFQNDEFPAHFADYCAAFAERYPWVVCYTPVNEIFIAATFSGQYGWWNECLTGDRSFVRALKNLCAANTLGMRAILQRKPRAIFIQSESSEFYHPEGPEALPLTMHLNQRRFLALDLTYGHEVSSGMYEYLLDNGMTREEYHWFLRNQVKARCVMGNDYYVTNEHLVFKDGSTKASGEIFGYYTITKQYYDRYRLPVMHTETNTVEPDAVYWLHKEISCFFRLKYDGIPLVGFTWYSLIDQVDWDSALRENAGRVNALGLYDLDRRIRPVGVAYRDLIKRLENYFPPETLTLDLSEEAALVHA
jgi:beta-glucosidase/6-phospho-beta-glucosidase/beta-galactosidase